MSKSATAAIVISGTLGLYEWKEAIFLWRTQRKDFAVWVTAFLVTIFTGVDYGLMASVGLALLIVIYESAFPHTAMLGRIPGTTVYRNIYQYPQAEMVRVPIQDCSLVAWWPQCPAPLFRPRFTACC